MSQIEPGTQFLRTPGYSVTVDCGGIVDVSCPGRGFSCLVSDLPYILLCDNEKIDQLREALDEQEKELQRLKERLDR